MKVRLILWNVEEAKACAAVLRRAGFAVDASPFTPPAVRKMKDLPEAIVIDLSRLPSQGRDAALFLRQVKATRGVPLVFVDGEEEKVAGIRRILPDATYATWPTIAGAIRQARAHRLAAPLSPGVFAGYAGVPLAKKLGVKPNAAVVLVNALPGFERQFGTLPPGVRIRRNARGQRDLTLWFVKSRSELERGIGSMKDHAASAGLWILWPKQNSKRTADVSQVVVRKVGLAAGIVDFKISAIDATWSGLRFTQREGKRR